MHYLYLISVWIHILSATVWMGGAAFLALVLVPALKHPDFQSLSSSLLHPIGVRFRKVGWVCLSILILTGCFNLGFRGYTWMDCLDGSVFRGAFGRILAIKLLGVGFILFLSVIHDFFLGPRAV